MFDMSFWGSEKKPTKSAQSTSSSWGNSLYNTSRWLLNTSYQTVFTVAGLMLPSSVKSTICFEYQTHDNSLDCISSSQEQSLYNFLVSNCSVYQDQNNDCANFFTTTNYFGKGVFGGSVCQWSYHTDFENAPCIYNVLNANVQNGYGTGVDILATIGIVAGGLVIVGGAAMAAASCYSRYNRDHHDLVDVNREPLHIQGEASSLFSRSNPVNQVAYQSLSNGNIQSGDAKVVDMEKVPEKYICLISSEIMTDPVALPSGEVVDRHSIEQWLDTNKINPYTREPLDKRELNPVRFLKEEIEEFLKPKSTSNFTMDLKT